MQHRIAPRFVLRHFACGVAGVLAFGIGVGGTAEAQEPTTIWAATMIVGEDPNEITGVPDYQGYVNDYERFGSLEPDQFTYGGRIHTVTGIWRNTYTGDTYLIFDDAWPGDPRKLTLSLGDVALRGLDVASVRDEKNFLEMRWTEVEVDWALGDTIPVGLTTTGQPPPPPNTALTAAFGASSYEAAEGGAPATVEVRLSADPRRRVALPIGRAARGGASESDYSGVPTHVVFHSGETRKTFTVRATDDAIDDDGESVELSFGPLPDGVSLSSPATTTISLLDDDQGGLSVPASLYLDEGGTATYPVVLKSRPTGTVTVEVSVPTGAPLTATPGSLTFTTANWDRARNVTVTAPLDGDQTPNPPVNILNTAAGGGYDGQSATVQVTVVEADLPSFGIEDARAGEADGHITFTVSLSESIPIQLTVDYATSDGTGGSAASAGSDYTFRSGTLNFPPNTSTRTIDVPIIDDREDEAIEETFTVTLSGPSGAAVLRDPVATGTIVDNDLVASFGAASYGASEGGANAAVSVVLSEAPGRELTIPIEAAGLRGASSDDYSGVPTSLVFGANQTSRTFEVVATDDAVDDDGESVRLSFGTLPATVTAGSPSSATVALTDDDAPGLSVPARVSVDEGGTADYAVVLESEPTSNVTVTVTVASGSDLSASLPSLTFTRQNWNQAQTVTVTAAHDEDVDDDEVVITHSARGGGYKSVSETVVVTINEDDLGIRFDTASYTVDEGGAVVVTVVLTRPPTVRGEIRIDAGNLGGATSDDYRGFPKRIALSPGETTRFSTVFSAVDDDVDDDNESVRLSFGSLPPWLKAGSPSTATVTITDNDERGLSVPESLTMVEGDTLTYQIALSSQPTSDVTVNIALDLGGRASLTFTPANWRSGQVLSIIAEHDGDAVDDEGVIVHTASGGGYDGVADTVALTIVDDDVEVRFGAQSYRLEEGVADAFVSLHLSRPLGRPVNIPIGRTFLHGTESTGFSPTFPLIVTFSATDSTRTFPLSMTDNDRDDPLHQMRLYLGHLPPNVLAGSPSSTIVNVIDDEVKGISVPATVDVREGSTVQYSVVLASRPSAAVTVTLTTDRDGITINPATLTFQPAAWNRAQTVTVTGPPGDVSKPNTYPDVKILHVATGGDYHSLSSSTTVRIEDRSGGGGGGGPRRRSVARPVVLDRSASEDADSMIFTVTPGETAETPVTFAYATSDGAGGSGAEAEADYTPTSGTVTFPANSTHPRTFSVPIIDDSDDEGDEFFTVTLSDPSGDGTVPDVTATGTIEDDDGAADPAGRIQVYFRPGSATATEGGAAAVVDVVVSEAPSGTVVVPLVTANRGGASDSDYSGIPTEVAFDSGSMVQSFVVTATDDGDDDDGEFLHVSFGALPTGMFAASPSYVRVDLADDDGGGGGTDGGSTTVSFAADSYRVDEGSGIEIALMLGLPRADRLEVPLMAVNRGGVDGSDYAGVPASIVLEAGETIGTFVLSARRDALFEHDQTVELSVGDLPPGVGAGDPATSVVTIVDEFAEPAIVVSGGRASEADPAVVFVVQLTAPTDGFVSARWKTSDGTAVAGRDYRESSGLLTFPTGATGPVVIRVPVLDDGIDEDDESLSLDVYDPVNVTRVRGAAGTIVDDDERGVNVLPRHLRIEEGQSGSYRVALGSRPAGDVTVTVMPGRDIPIEIVPATLTFTPANWESGQQVTVSVPDDDDAFVEPPVALRHRVAGGDYEGESAPSVEVMILETDFPGVRIDDPRAGEADGEIVFAVQLDKQTNRTVSVAWATQDGTAITGEDYVGASGEVVFAPHETGKRVAIDLVDDGVDEPAEHFALVLAEPVNATLGDPRGIGTIGDDDLPQIGIEAETDQVTEGEAARFRLFRAGDLSVALEVPVRVTQRGDYIAGEPPASVSFAVDDDTAALSVATEDDLLDEADGAISVALREGAGHEIAGSASAEVAVADNDRAPSVAVSDASAFEGAGDIAFPVALSAPSGRTISIAWTTAEGTATAGTDFVAATGSLLFPPGQTADTIRVALVDDLVDEDDETFTVSLSDPLNVVLVIGEATGTITDDDLAVAKAWLSRFGRSVASQVVDAVDSRFSRAPGEGNALSLGGAGLARGEARRAPPGWMDILTGSSFRYSTVSGDGPGRRPGGWTAWGRGATTTFSGAEPDLTINGQVRSVLVGVDYERGAFLGGVLLSHSRGTGDFAGIAGEGAPERTGEVESSLTGAFPYLRVGLGDRIRAWGLAGRGSGSMTTGLDEHGAGIRLDMGAFGARGTILSPGGATGLGLDLKYDAFFAAMDSQRSRGGIPAETANASRIRLALEGVRSVAVGAAGAIGLSLEAGLRRDGGDAETGMGIEVGGGSRFSHRALGLTVETRARALLAHQDEHYEEWGLSGALVFDPDDTTQGFSMRVRSSWGASMGGVDRLWSQRPMDGFSGRSSPANRQRVRLNAGFRYGMSSFGGRALMTPHATVTLAGDDARAYRLGWSVKVGRYLTIGLENALGEGTGSLREGMLLRVSMRR